MKIYTVSRLTALAMTDDHPSQPEQALSCNGASFIEAHPLFAAAMEQTIIEHNTGALENLIDANLTADADSSASMSCYLSVAAVFYGHVGLLQSHLGPALAGTSDKHQLILQLATALASNRSTETLKILHAYGAYSMNVARDIGYDFARWVDDNIQ